MKYGCDIQDKSHGLKIIYELLKNDWYMMCECLINYDHWVVVCVYFTNDEDEVSKHNIMIYDPYYNQVRLINAEEFGAMWISGEHATNNVKLDFIAVKHQ